MISVIIPVLNEEESVALFYKELKEELIILKTSFEVIFVDDGSDDKSLFILKKFAKKDKHVKLFSFRKNQGKSEALTQGFLHAKGEYIVTLDADLQDKPTEIKKLLKRSKEGIDLVCGWRKKRNDPFFKVLSSNLFNFLAGIFWGLRLHDFNCGLKVYKKEAAKSLRLYGGMHRFIPLLLYEEGFLVDEVSVEHDKRRFGHSKYGFSKLWKDLPDMFTMLFLTRYGKRPLHLFWTVGSTFSLAGVFILLYLSMLHFQGHTIGRRPLLFLGMLLVLGGFQLFFTGFLADLMININQRSIKDTKALLKYSTDPL